MQTNELETKIEHMTEALTDDRGELVPIERIDFERIGRQIRWSVWSDGRRLQSITTRIGELAGLLEASKLLLEMAVADAAGPGETVGNNEKSFLDPLT